MKFPRGVSLKSYFASVLGHRGLIKVLFCFGIGSLYRPTKDQPVWFEYNTSEGVYLFNFVFHMKIVNNLVFMYIYYFFLNKL